jgi:signal transduction histidine kinase
MARPHPVLWLRRNPDRADALLGVVVASLAVVFHLTITEADNAADPSAWGVAISVLATLPVAWRRRAPFTVLAVVVGAQVVAEALNVEGSGWTGVLIASYTVGAYRSGRLLTYVGTGLVAASAGFTVLGVFVSEVPWQAVITTTVTIAGALLVGDSVRRRRERQAELLERAERAERERELLAREQVHHERTRIARELHDVVAHSLTVMVIQASAAQRTTDQIASREAMAVVEATGRGAMTEMRRILGVLRDGDEPLAGLMPQPSLGALRSLVDDTTDLPVHFDLRCAPDELADLPAGVELSVYRIVQEGLTNVRRHAGHVDEVLVTVGCADDAVVVEVLDDGRGAASMPTSDGFGLLGMRERVAVHDGTLTVGPRAGGGWRVKAVIPVHA